MAFTFFFRDVETLKKAIDDFTKGLYGKRHIKIWSAGCASGKETYTLAILLAEQLDKYTFNNITIIASDIQERFAEQVTKAIYHQDEILRIPHKTVEKYFTPDGAPGYFQVQPELRERVKFITHDLLTYQPPDTDFQMIVCKNVLLHFQEEERKRVIRMFYQCLVPGGYLVFEPTQELPPEMRDKFVQIYSAHQIYRKKPLMIEEEIANAYN